MIHKIPGISGSLNQKGRDIYEIALRIRGQTNQVYLIQASTDLLNWQTIGTNIAVQGMILFRDPEASMTYNAR